MEITSTVSSKGQITLPAEVRDRLGVGSGDKVKFVFDGEQTVVKPVRTSEDPFEKWRGVSKGEYKTEGDLLRSLHEMRGWDEWDEKEYSK